MTGTAFDPADFDPKPEHRCQPPNADSFSAPHGWRCECGKAYRRVSDSQHGESWYAWRRMPEADE